MKKSICLAAGLFALNLLPVLGQPPGGQPPQPPLGTEDFQQRLAKIRASTMATSPAPVLTAFNLDFPGGTPAQLVQAIEDAMRKPISVIIDKEDDGVKLPPIKGSELDVDKLFQTLSEYSQKYAYTPGRDRVLISWYGFKTLDPAPSDHSLWTFYSESTPQTQTQFSLDFAGGTPRQLIEAIQKAMGKPLNVIINQEDENIVLPALTMKDVYLSQLFAALEAASLKQVAYNTNPNPGRLAGGVGFNSYSVTKSGYAFSSADPNNDASIWYFHVDKPALPPLTDTDRVCQYFSLAHFLDRGFTVDDITTAIQTGWKMSGETSPPELNYHKETKLLIAFGDPSQLKTITDVLDTLPDSKATHDEKNDDELNALRAKINSLEDKLAAKSPAAATPAGGKAGQ